MAKLLSCRGGRGGINGYKTMLYFWGLTLFPISTLSPFSVSYVWHPAHSYHLPVLQNDLVDNFPADNTFPSPEVFMGTVEFIINHDTMATMAPHKEISLPSLGLIIRGSDVGMK